MAQHMPLPAVDFLSWTHAGQPWTDFEWLTQLLAYALYCAGGLTALWAFKTLVFAAVSYFLWKTLSLYNAKYEFIWALPLFAAAVSVLADWRADNSTVLFFAVLIYLLEKLRLAQNPPQKIPRRALAAFCMFALWVNLHAGFAYGLALMGFYGIGFLLKARQNSGRIKLLSACLIAALLGTLCNPYGWKMYSVLFIHAGEMNALTAKIIEWMPSRLSDVRLLAFWVLFFPAAALAAWRIFRERAVSGRELALAYFSYAAIAHVRNLPFCVLLALPVAADALKTCGGGKIRGVLRGVFFTTAFLFCLGASFSQHMADSFSSVHGVRGAARYLKDNKDALAGKRLYNSWGWGGYLGFNLNPDYKIFVDGRYIFHRHLGEVAAAMSSVAKWKAFMDRYGFDIMVLPASKTLFPSPVQRKDGTEETLPRPFYVYYLPQQDWALLYWDDYCYVFGRRGALEQKWLAEHEFIILRPGDSRAAKVFTDDVPDRKYRLAAELRRHAAFFAGRPAPESAAPFLEILK